MSRAKGQVAEQQAAKYLQKQGFRLLASNFSCRFGEIDLIVSRNDVVHFVEVKSGTSFDPVNNITPQKLQRIIKTAEIFMKQKSLDLPYQLDAVIIRGDEVEHLENITL